MYNKLDKLDKLDKGLQCSVGNTEHEVILKFSVKYETHNVKLLNTVAQIMLLKDIFFSIVCGRS